MSGHKPINTVITNKMDNVAIFLDDKSEMLLILKDKNEPL